MDIQTQIRQQQATVQMLEKLLRARRCSQADVDQAKNILRTGHYTPTKAILSPL